MTVQEASRTVLVPTDLGGRQVLVKFFRALGDSTRLSLLEFLVEDAHTVGACVQAAGLSQGRVLAHLGCLADCGYVVARRAGRNTYYRVADPRVPSWCCWPGRWQLTTPPSTPTAPASTPDPDTDPRSTP